MKCKLMLRLIVTLCAFGIRNWLKKSCKVRRHILLFSRGQNEISISLQMTTRNDVLFVRRLIDLCKVLPVVHDISRENDNRSLFLISTFSVL